ncbi:MAG: PEP-CTERM sorting domain-containing protein [Planctomycetota bacterium]|nr:MAG: PEP-CTERM sorting domain-containing protein [Planctomycetota bacterium]
MKRFLSSCARLPRVVISIGVAALLASLAVPARAVTIDMVTVGNPGNANDTTNYGGVNYSYQIGKYDVTIGQYTDFLNAVATTDTYSLYNTSMATDLNVAGIARAGSSGSYTYSVINNGGDSSNRPITYVSWWDSARFSNWMANGQPTGAQSSTTTENGAYNVNGATSGNAPAKNVTNPNTSAAPTLFIPNENEWYKAAYFDPTLNSGSGGYYAYATQSNTAPGNIVGSGTNQANYKNGLFSVTQASSYSASQNYLTDVGAFTNSASFYGTFDQSGIVFQWNDLDGTSGSSRGLRGGDWNLPASFLLSSTGFSRTPSDEDRNIGFRLASPVAVPEPSTYCMALAGLACGGYTMFRRRRAR